jgi:hypothetical protein
MSNVVVSRSSLENTADAIRDVYENILYSLPTSTYKPSEFADAIRNLKNKCTNVLTGCTKPQNTQGAPGDLYIFYNEPFLRSLPSDEYVPAAYIEPSYFYNDAQSFFSMGNLSIYDITGYEIKYQLPKFSQYDNPDPPIGFFFGNDKTITMIGYAKHNLT